MLISGIFPNKKWLSFSIIDKEDFIIGINTSLTPRTIQLIIGETKMNELKMSGSSINWNLWWKKKYNNYITHTRKPDTWFSSLYIFLSYKQVISIRSKWFLHNLTSFYINILCICVPAQPLKSHNQWKKKKLRYSELLFDYTHWFVRTGGKN